MRAVFDPKAQALYVAVQPAENIMGPIKTSRFEAGDGYVLVDLDRWGRPVGLEIGGVERLETRVPNGPSFDLLSG